MENSDSSFSFQHVPKDKITKTIKKLDPKKVIQSNDIPTKLIKIFSVFFSDYIYICVSTDKVATDLLVLFQMFQKFTKSVCMIRSMVFLKIIFQDINADFVAVSITKILFDINFCDLFLSEYNSEFSNFVGDTTPYECGENYVEVINKLEDAIESLRIIYQDKKSDFETWLKNDIVSQFT